MDFSADGLGAEAGDGAGSGAATWNTPNAVPPLSLREVRYLCIDEYDKMLSMGMLQQVHDAAQCTVWPLSSALRMAEAVPPGSYVMLCYVMLCYVTDGRGRAAR